jgi:hypothetical protein
LGDAEGLAVLTWLLSSSGQYWPSNGKTFDRVVDHGNNCADEGDLAQKVVCVCDRIGKMKMHLLSFLFR